MSALSDFALLLKAFLREAKDDFFVRPADTKDDCEECAEANTLPFVIAAYLKDRSDSKD